jgi:hypothetical protein
MSKPKAEEISCLGMRDDAFTNLKLGAMADRAIVVM